MRPLFERVQSDVVLFEEALVAQAPGVTSSYVSLEQYRGVGFVVAVGPLAQGESVQITVLQATDAGGSGAQAIAGVEAEIEASAQGDAFKAAEVWIGVGELTVQDGFTHVALNLVGPATAQATAAAIRHDPRYLPPD